MPGLLRTIILADDEAGRNQPLELGCARLTYQQLLAECADLEAFRRTTGSLYHRVRALFFLYALHRYFLPARQERAAGPSIPFAGQQLLYERRYEEAIGLFLDCGRNAGITDPLSSALAASYRGLAFQTLADQVRRSVRSVRGNQWMFRSGHPADYPLRIRPELLQRARIGDPFPVLREQTPVRMDLTHSAWSDIFFLGMDYPEGARVLNVSIDLGVLGRDSAPRPPVEAYLRVIDEPVLRLVSVDLEASATITTLAEVFDFARDYLGLLKAAVIASGLIPPGMEGAAQPLDRLLSRLLGPGLGLELVSSVNGIPKGSRLAVSTNLLAALISACMRATGQIRELTGSLREEERRLVAARAILGEWLGGSGGGWQDSGGVWSGIKKIEGAPATPDTPEYGISRGCLLPRHHVLGDDEVPPAARQALQDSLILVHGGMAQNVGPILEMVTEKYLLRSHREWTARQQALELYAEIVSKLKAGQIRELARLTTENFRGPIRTIIPWANNLFTETVIDAMQTRLGADFWGFWMLGGMSGGGMGFMVDPRRKQEAQTLLRKVMTDAQQALGAALPFAMKPVVYDFAINPHGTFGSLLSGTEAMMPSGYYGLMIPGWLRKEPRDLPAGRRQELERFGAACRERPDMAGMVQTLFNRIFPATTGGGGGRGELDRLLAEQGFDAQQHEQIRADLRQGRIGLAQNRLPPNWLLEVPREGDVHDATAGIEDRLVRLGQDQLDAGAVAVVTLGAGAGSRWTQGAGTVKALHPFCELGGKYRTFLEVHLAKSRRVGRKSRHQLPFVLTTGFLTDAPIRNQLVAAKNYHYPGHLHLSPGRAIGLRFVPMVRDLRFAWEEMPGQNLDEQAQKVRESARAALLAWAQQAGEGSDYTDNLPQQCLHPVGHWSEVPNLLRNGVLARLLAERPALRYLLVHNIDTVGASVDPGLLGLHIERQSCLSFEVIRRRLEDQGGGLARVEGHLRLVEGLALPREEDEARLTYYNSLTTWVTIDKLLHAFGLDRDALNDPPIVTAAVARMASRMPTYVTLKDVKKRWGYGQEDVFPVCQFEKLWGDMTTLPDIGCSFVEVPRVRGQQLKDQAQLDGWLRDGSAAYVESLCDW